MTKDEALTMALEALEELDGLDTETESVTIDVGDVIAALKAALEHQAEPVAYLCENAVGHKYFRWKKPSSTYKPIALYTTPPQRTWVGLTDEEQQQAYEQWQNEGWGVFYRAIETKLKEKNNG
jgi:pyruvate/2-oxoglutarate dehydrogenase complex dihydrolipoamide dehydrogenase (E3) component